MASIGIQLRKLTSFVFLVVVHDPRCKLDYVDFCFESVHDHVMVIGYVNDYFIAYIEKDLLDMLDNKVNMDQFQKMKPRRGQL